MATAQLLAAMSALPSPPPSSEMDLDGKRGPGRLGLAASTSSPPSGPVDALPMPTEGIEPLKVTARAHSRKHSLLSPPSSTPPQARQERRAAARRPPRRSVVFAGQLHQDGVSAVPKHRQMLFYKSPVAPVAVAGCPPESPTGRGSRVTLSSSPLRRTSVASAPSDDDYAMSDASVLSDDDVLERLVPNLRVNRRRARPSHDGPSMVPSSPSRSPAKKRVRSILKRTTNSNVVVAEDLVKATMANGRYRAAPVGSRQVGPSATGKALMQILSDAPGNAADGTTPNLGASGSLLPPAETSTRGGAVFEGRPTDGPSTARDKGKGKAPSPPGAALTQADQIDEQIGIISACLQTLVASLRPLPTEMRLDPMSPLASLATPLRLRLGPLGGLADSPREPIDVLPRPPPSSFSEDLRRHLASAVPETPNGPPSSPRPFTFQAVITLRDVEDAYSTMSFALESLSSAETSDARLRVAQLLEGASDDLVRCLLRDITNLVEDHATASDSEPRRQRSLSSSLEKARAAKSLVEGAEAAKEKGGETTSEIRRRTAEVEAGQTAIKALAWVLGVREWSATLPDADASRLIGLVIKVPDTPRLLKKKHMPVLALHNQLFANQVLKPALLAPYALDIVNAITSTLYLACQKKSDRCRKVIVDGMHAIAKLSAQAPSSILPHYARFLEVLLAGLTSPNASIRWAAVRALGGVVRGCIQSWEGGPAPSNVEGTEATDAESIRQQLSVCALAYLQRSRPREEVAILGEQLDKSIQTGDLAWALCAIGVVAAVLGKRLRKLGPTGPCMLVTRVQDLIQKPHNVPCRTLAYQVWDFFVCSWLQASMHTKEPSRPWALEGKPLDYLLQILNRGNNFWNPAGHGEPVSSNSQKHMLSTTRNVISLLYGSVGYVVNNLPPAEGPVPLGRKEHPRHEYTSILWSRIVATDVAQILEGASDACRLHGWHVLVALLDNDRSSDGDRRPWSVERLLRPAFLEAPMMAATPDLALEEMIARMEEDPILPSEIPSLDPAWICINAKSILPKIGQSLVSTQYIQDPDAFEWSRTADGELICPAAFTSVWRRYLGSLKVAGDNVDMARPFQRAFRDVMLGIRNVVKPGSYTLPEGVDDSASPACLGLRLLSHLYHVAKDVFAAVDSNDADVVRGLQVTWAKAGDESSASIRLAHAMISMRGEILADETDRAARVAYADVLERFLLDGLQFGSDDHLLGVLAAAGDHVDTHRVAMDVIAPELENRWRGDSKVGDVAGLVEAACRYPENANEAFERLLLLHLGSGELSAVLVAVEQPVAKYLAVREGPDALKVYEALLEAFADPSVIASLSPATIANLTTAPFSQGTHRRPEATDAFKAFWTTVKGQDAGAQVGAFPRVHELVKALVLSTADQDGDFSSGGLETQVVVLESFDSAGPDVASLLQPTPEAPSPAAAKELDVAVRLDDEEEDDVAVLPMDPAPPVEGEVGPASGTPSTAGDFFEETASIDDPDKAVILDAPSDSSPEPESICVAVEAFQGTAPNASALVDEALASSASEGEGEPEADAKAEKGKKGAKKRKRKSAIGASKKKRRASSQSGFVSGKEDDEEDDEDDGVILVPFKYATAEEKERSRSWTPASSEEEGDGPASAAAPPKAASSDKRGDGVEGAARRKRTLTRITSGLASWIAK